MTSVDEPKFALDPHEAIPVHEKLCRAWPTTREDKPIPPSYELYVDACRRFYNEGKHHMTYRDVAVALLNDRWPRG